MIPEIFTAIFIFSFVPIAIKFTSANPFTMGFFRLSVATLLIAIFWRKKINWRAYKVKTFWKLIVIGTCFFCHWITYTFSIKIGGPSMTVMAMSTYGIQLIFYGSFFLGYHVNKKNIACLLLILFGVIFLIPSWDFQNKATLGFLLALVSASFYAVVPIMLQKSHEFNLETRTFAQFSTALIGYALLFPFSRWTELTQVDWWGLLFLAVFGTFIAHSLWSRVVASVPTTTSGIAYYMITPSAMFFSWILLGEKLSSKQLIGGGVILAAALINSLNQERFNQFISIFNFKRIN